MKQSADTRFREVMDGSDRSPSAAAMRTVASIAEPFYANVMRVRNSLYDAGIFKTHPLGRPTISVGNITTGGTGKTPVVQWLCKSLIAGGKKPVILMRGYKRTADDLSDEASLYATENLPAITHPDRRAGAAEALQQYPDVNVFVLDDGMQHRRARRDFELTLIHAREPFGCGHVFPRGLLREPLPGLKRANAFLITHADEGDPVAVTRTLAQFNPTVPVFRCNHAIDADLAGKKYFAFCGIGSPESFFWRLAKMGGESVGEKAFEDHYDYRESDISALNAQAHQAGAEILVTTEKDWVKLAKFAPKFSIPVIRAKLKLEFGGDDGYKLMELLRQNISG